MADNKLTELHYVVETVNIEKSERPLQLRLLSQKPRGKKLFTHVFNLTAEQAEGIREALTPPVNNS